MDRPLKLTYYTTTPPPPPSPHFHVKGPKHIQRRPNSRRLGRDRPLCDEWSDDHLLGHYTLGVRQQRDIPSLLQDVSHHHWLWGEKRFKSVEEIAGGFCSVLSGVEIRCLRYDTNNIRAWQSSTHRHGPFGIRYRMHMGAPCPDEF